MPYSFRLTTHAEQEHTEQHFRTLVEDTSDWIWETDADALFTHSNPKIKDLLGYEPEEILGKRPTDLVQADERSRVWELVASLRSAPFLPFSCLEIPCLAKDGREVVFEVSGVPFFDSDGKLCGRRGIGRDITARPRTDALIRQSEEKFRNLVANIPDVVWTIDANLRFVYISPSVERISGFALEDVYRRGARLFVDCIHPDDVGRVHEALRALFADEQPYDVECRVHGRSNAGDGRVRRDRRYSSNREIDDYPCSYHCHDCSRYEGRPRALPLRGMDTYISKPVRPQKLFEAIDRALLGTPSSTPSRRLPES